MCVRGGGLCVSVCGCVCVCDVVVMVCVHLCICAGMCCCVSMVFVCGETGKENILTSCVPGYSFFNAYTKKEQCAGIALEPICNLSLYFLDTPFFSNMKFMFKQSVAYVRMFTEALPVRIKSWSNENFIRKQLVSKVMVII